MTPSLSQARNGVARIRVILAALLTAVRRDLRTVGSFSGNNLFIAGVGFLFLNDPGLFVTLAASVCMSELLPAPLRPTRPNMLFPIIKETFSACERRWR